VLPPQKKSLIPIIKIRALTFISQKSAEVGTKNFVYHTPRNRFANIRMYLQYSSATRTANRTHARKRAVSGLVIQITIVCNRTRNEHFAYREQAAKFNFAAVALTTAVKVSMRGSI
jgi:hypothetical protein